MTRGDDSVVWAVISIDYEADVSEVTGPTTDVKSGVSERAENNPFQPR